MVPIVHFCCCLRGCHRYLCLSASYPMILLSKKSHHNSFIITPQLKKMFSIGILKILLILLKAQCTDGQVCHMPWVSRLESLSRCILIRFGSSSMSWFVKNVFFFCWSGTANQIFLNFSDPFQVITDCYPGKNYLIKHKTLLGFKIKGIFVWLSIFEVNSCFINTVLQCLDSILHL